MTGDEGETGTRPLHSSSFSERNNLPVPGGGDDDLLERARRGDESAWSELVQRYAALVFSTALRTGVTREEAKDVFQKVWLEVHRSLLRISGLPSLTRWLITTTRRIAQREARTHQRWVNEALGDLIDPSPAALAEVEALESRQRLEWALERLGGRCELLLRLLFFVKPQPTQREVAKRLGVAANSVGPLRQRCLNRLRELMEEDS